MAVAIPLAFAVGAGAVTGWSLTAMSVGWLVGSWLFSPKSDTDVFDPGAEELPSVNQALRGATMPVLFGTNRCPVQIVWRDNFESERNESKSSSGGKMGGSGMGSKGAPAAAGDVSYTYTVDVMFHVGMVPEAYTLFGGWIGRDRIASTSIANITMGFGESSASLGGVTGGESDATLTFDDAHWFPGGDDDDHWSHLTTHGIRTRWPHTAGLGLKQLLLGSTPALPALTLEVGPGAINLVFDSGFIGKQSFGEALVGASLIRNQYVWADNNVLNVETAAITDTLTEAELEAYALSTFAVTLNFDGDFHGLPIPGTNYVLVKARDEDFVTHIYYLLEIGGDGTISIAGSVYYGSEPSSLWGTMMAVGLANQQTESDPILYCFSNHISTSHHPTIACLPSITDFLANTNASALSVNTVRLNTAESTLNRLFVDQAGQVIINGGWFVPRVSALGVWGTHFYWFAPKHEMDANKVTISSVTCDYLTTKYAEGYEDGLMIQWDLGNVVLGSLATGTPNVANDDFVDGSGLQVVPFDDDSRDEDGNEVLGGSVYTLHQYCRAPSVQPILTGPAAGATVVIFAKNFGSPDNGGAYNGCRVHLRAFIYSPLTQLHTQYGETGGSLFNAVTDLGSGASNSNQTTNEQFFVWRESTNQIYELRNVRSSVGAVDDFFAISEFGSLSIGGGDDVLPPYIIRQILVNDYFGVNPNLTIDEDSYQAALQYCDNEQIKVSTIYRREESVLRIIELLLATYGGFLTRNGNTIKFGLMDMSTDPVRTIDNHRLVSKSGEPPVQVTKGALQDTYNRVRVNYLDRSLSYRQNVVKADDEVDQDMFGVRLREFPPQFVMSEQTATKIAWRALWTNLYARDSYQFQLGQKDFDLEPGDVLTLVDSFHPALQTGVRARITRWRESTPGMFDVTAVQELEFASTAAPDVNSSTIISSSQLSGSALAPLAVSAYELPAEFSTSPQVYIGWNDAGQAAGAHLYLSPDNVTFARAMTVTPFPISGRLNTSLPARPHGWFEEDVGVYLFPSSGFSVSSPEFGRSFLLDDVAPEGRALGASLIWVGSEMCAYEHPTLVGSNFYRLRRLHRGWGGTNIHAHNSGDYFHKHGGGIFTQEYNEDKIGTTFYYKVAPFNFSGIEFPISSLTAQAHTIQGAYYRPQIAPSIHAWVASDDLRGEHKKSYATPQDLVFEWRDSARMAGFGAAGYGLGVGGFGRFTTDTMSHAWRVEVVGSGNLVVRSTVVSTTQFAYTAAQNSGDNGAWRGNIAIKVTAFNHYGDCPRASVESLQLSVQ